MKQHDRLQPASDRAVDNLLFLWAREVALFCRQLYSPCISMTVSQLPFSVNRFIVLYADEILSIARLTPSVTNYKTYLLKVKLNMTG